MGKGLGRILYLTKGRGRGIVSIVVALPFWTRQLCSEVLVKLRDQAVEVLSMQKVCFYSSGFSILLYQSLLASLSDHIHGCTVFGHLDWQI